MSNYHKTNATLPEAIAQYCPHDSINWELIETLPWVDELKVCPQDSRYHPEGDVWTHTKLCCEWLIQNKEWQSLSLRDRQIVFLAVLMHDFGKAKCTKITDDGISSKGHSGIGECNVRKWLYENDTDMVVREEIASLIRFHQMPFHFLKAEDIEKEVIKVSLNCSCSKLHLLASADINGRHGDSNNGKESVDMLKAYAEDLGCLNEPFKIEPFNRFAYFYLNRNRFSNSFNNSRLNIYMMSGLPAAGKDWIIAKNYGDLSVISLDDIRLDMGIRPEDGPTKVVYKAREYAKIFMQSSRDFVFNATSLTRKIREEWISYFNTYSGLTHIIHVECPLEERIKRNKSRTQCVPDHVLHRMTDSWQVPSFEEGYQVEWIRNMHS